MTICVIELNDSEIRVSRDNDIILRSPGYALLGNDGITLGEEAAQQARLQPRFVHDRFWKNLNQDPLTNPGPGARHNADLAYAQILHIYEQAGKPDSVMVTVPGSYSNTELSLLLGLFEASPFQVSAMIDTAVAACAGFAPPGQHFYLDLHLHQLMVTEIEVGEQVKRKNVHLVDSAGVHSIYDTAAHAIADLFIKESRFDPQHHPDTEQALYDQIPQCLGALNKHEEVTLEIQYQDVQHQAKLKRSTLEELLAPLYGKISAVLDKDSSCFMSEHLSQLPGINSILRNTNIIPPYAIHRSCVTNKSLLETGDSTVNFVTTLPATPIETATAVTEVKQTTHSTEPDRIEDSITHVLYEHSARPLNDSLKLSATGLYNDSDHHCLISGSGNQVRAEPTSELTVYVNGKQIDAAISVKCGDIIGFAGSKTEFRLIRVEG